MKYLKKLWEKLKSKIDYWLFALGLITFTVSKEIIELFQSPENAGPALSFGYDVFQGIFVGLVPLGLALSIAFIVMKLVVPNGKKVFDTMFINENVKACTKAWLSLCLFLGVSLLSLMAIMKFMG